MKKSIKILNKKQFVILMVTLILSLISMLNFSVAKYSNFKENVIVYLKKGDIINSILISKNSISLKSLENNNIILNSEGELECINDTNLNLNISVIDDLIINMSSYNKILYSTNSQEFEVQGGPIRIVRSTVDILKKSLDKNSIMIFIISFVVIMGCVNCIVCTTYRIKSKNIKIWDIVIFLLSIFLIYISNIYLLMMINKILAFIPALILTIYILWSLKFRIEKWEDLFLCITGIIGSIMLFIITPGNVPDEPSHYIRAYVDSIAFTKEAKDNVKLPKSIDFLMGKFTHDVHNLQVKYSGKSYITELTSNSNYNELNDNVSIYENTKYLSFLPYVPSTIINFFSRILNLPIIISFLLCRLTNLVISTILCYYAIKTTPKFKKVFVLIATLPVFLQQAMGINMDYMTNSVAILYIATILKYCFEDRTLNIQDIVVLTIEGIVLGFCKFGYFPLLLLIFMIPNEKMKNNKVGIIFKIVLCVIPIIISCLANFSYVSKPNMNENEMYTISTVINNPINSFKICARTFLKRCIGDVFLKLIDGFGWSTKYQIETFLWIVGSIYIILMFSDNEDSCCLKRKDRINFLIIFSIIYLILYGVAFTEWTSLNMNTINGLQARYFIPILPLFYIAISNNFLKLNVKDKWKFYTILLFVAELLSTMSILIAFY